jgi:hypothetical protein
MKSKGIFRRAVTGSSVKNVSAATVPLNGGASGVKASDRGIASLKFADKVKGWMMTAAYRLLATQDGGSSWKDITPHSSAPALRQETVPIPKKGLATTVTCPASLIAAQSFRSHRNAFFQPGIRGPAV